MKTTSLGIIGGGRVTRIILQGFKNKKTDLKSVKVYDHHQDTVEALKQEYPEIELAASPAEAADARVVIIALHPPVIMEMIGQIAGIVSEETILVSLAPKVTIEEMSGTIQTGNIVRMIPNATSYINKGFNPIVFHQGMGKKDRKMIMKLFKPLGKLIKTEEHKLEGYAIMSGMLPTYFWFQFQELENIGIQTGLSAKEAQKAIRSTLKPSVDLYFKSGLTPPEVIDLIPVRPLAENEEEIRSMYNNKLLGLYNKIKPEKKQE